MWGLTGNSFEDFFHDVMTLCVPGFVDVRTHGKLGDKGSDGMSLHFGKLYACYAPETPNAAASIAKLRSDVKSALRQRNGQFTTFVFVHNDVRGVHPDISEELVSLSTDHPGLQFELMGMRHIRDLLGGAARISVEDVLKMPLPIEHTVTVGLEEMEDLLQHLAANRVISSNPGTASPVSVQKLHYSELTVESQAEVRDGMKHSGLIDSYYGERIDVTELDDVAARFRAEYVDAKRSVSEPEEILLRLRVFLAGSKTTAGPAYRAQTAVLAYFFQRCDIFDNPPAGWVPPVALVTQA